MHKFSCNQRSLPVVSRRAVFSRCSVGAGIVCFPSYAPHHSLILFCLTQFAELPGPFRNCLRKHGGPVMNAKRRTSTFWPCILIAALGFLFACSSTMAQTATGRVIGT